MSVSNLQAVSHAHLCYVAVSTLLAQCQ